MRLIRFTSRGKRLKGLDEFDTLDFVGRMDRVQRRRDLAFATAVFVAVLVKLSP